MSQQPDIIFVVLDTQRADRLGCYGYERPLSPNLDRFAAESLLFEMAIAPAQWTIPSHASMFSGLYPTAHQVTQSNQALSAERPQLAERLQQAGYETVAFCNNPLVGVLQNGFRRGFDQFFVYAGAAPNPYNRFATLPASLRRLALAFENGFRRIALPIQNYFGQSDAAFRLSINAWITPLWSRLANFKGQNERSVRHINAFLQQREQRASDKPLFMFVNLMETHLPFRPPADAIEKVAPYLLTDRQAQREMQRWNREAYRWAAPLAQPLAELEQRVLNDLYDAEVAYQDRYLGEFFETLARRRRKRETLTIFVGDHGDGLGEHNMVGHAFNAYQELLHVPLIVHWPEQIEHGRRESTAVSTRRIFQTMVAAAGAATPEERSLSLLDGSDEPAFAEVYPPLNFVHALQHRQPELLERFNCLALRRAVVQNDFKLIAIDDRPGELYDLVNDAPELNNLAEAGAAEMAPLAQSLREISEQLDQAQHDQAAGDTFELNDERLLQQLRGLGYVE